MRRSILKTKRFRYTLYVRENYTSRIYKQRINCLFAEGNAIKYICRHSHKGGLEDIEKLYII